MNRNEIKNVIKKLASQIFKKPIDSNSLKKSLVMELGVDSLEIVELIMAIEKEFSLEFPNSMSNEFNTLQDIIDNVVNLTEKQTKA